MKKIFVICALVVSLISCSSDLDLNQANRLKLNSVFVGNFGSFDFEAKQFVSGGVEQNFVRDKLIFDIFKYKNFTDNLTRADLEFEFTNTVNRGYFISVNFFNSDDVKVHTFTVAVPAYSGTENVILHREIFEKTNLNLFTTTQKVSFEVVLKPGIPLTDSSLGRLKMRSGATIYYTAK